jgi:diguanylate cyclase (GGDEF)-like protein/PAS domain S-box-containing protein
MIEMTKGYGAPQVEDFDLFSMAFSSAAIGMALVATDGRFLNVNDAMCAITGYSRTELLTRDFQAITHPDDLDTDMEHARQLLAGERNTYRLEKRYIRRDGSTAWVLLTVSLARRPSGEPRILIAQVQDLDAQKRAENELAAFFELCSDLLAIASPDGVLARLNPAWQTVLGWSAEELEGTSIASLLHPDDVERTAAEFARIARQGQADQRWVNRYRHKEGGYRWLEWTTSVRQDGSFVGVARYITEQRANAERTRSQKRELEESNSQLCTALEALQQVNTELQAVHRELENLAWYDSLTGLGNRNLFISQLEQAIKVSARREDEFALLVVDLDGFKAVNDTLGHAAGDAALQEVANRLRQALRNADQSYRLGGDEFAALLVPEKNELRDGPRAAAAKILHVLSRPMRVSGRDFRIGASIGIALFPRHGQEAGALVRKADAAMYAAKSNNASIAMA